jgi:NADPH-dependent ferric siderophore reductase
MNQRMNYLSFSANGSTLTVTAPANANLAPPGHYLLFVVDANGVPSVARIVRIS